MKSFLKTGCNCLFWIIVLGLALFFGLFWLSSRAAKEQTSPTPPKAVITLIETNRIEA